QVYSDVIGQFGEVLLVVVGHSHDCSPRLEKDRTPHSFGSASSWRWPRSSSPLKASSLNRNSRLPSSPMSSLPCWSCAATAARRSPRLKHRYAPRPATPWLEGSGSQPLPEAARGRGGSREPYTFLFSLRS